MRTGVLAVFSILLAGCASKHLNQDQRKSVTQFCEEKVGIDSTLSKAFNKDYKRCLSEEGQKLLLPQFTETCEKNLGNRSHPLLDKCVAELPNLSRDRIKCFNLWPYESASYHLCIGQLDMARFNQERRCSAEGLRLGTPDFGACINRLETARILANEASKTKREAEELKESREELERYKSNTELCKALKNPSLCPN